MANITPISNSASVQKLIEKWEPIEDLDELKRIIADLLVKFDTDPKRYTKKDFFDLLRFIYRVASGSSGGGGDWHEEVEKLKRLCYDLDNRVDGLTDRVDNLE